MVNLDQLKECKERILHIKESIKYDKLCIELEEEELKSQDPELWKDNKRMSEHQKNISNIKHQLGLFESLRDAYDMLEMAIELNEEVEADNTYNQIIKELADAELEIMLSDEADNMNCIFTINAGAGGTEANDWAGMLYRMYKQYFINNGYKYKDVNINPGDVTGFKSVSIEVEGPHAFGFLKAEIGVHRLVRVSPYNAQGKRMTSFAAVFVSPLVDDSITVELDKANLSFDYFRCSGAGGQNVNKVNSGVRARYWYTDPDTGEKEEILVENTETRDQPKNKDNAIRILKGILYNKELERKKKKQAEIEDSKTKNEWGNQIRSYVLDDSRVKDHRTNYEDRNVNNVLNGHIDEFIKQYLMMYTK